MGTDRHYPNKATPSGLSNVRLNDYDRALAQSYMDQGAACADLAIRAMSGLRTLVETSGVVLHAVFAQKRSYVKNGVVHVD